MFTLSYNTENTFKVSIFKLKDNDWDYFESCFLEKPDEFTNKYLLPFDKFSRAVIGQNTLLREQNRTTGIITAGLFLIRGRPLDF